SSTCFVSTATWRNTPITTQTGSFSVEFEATPNNANMNGIVALSKGPGDAFDDFATLIRFNNEGYIDVRDGNTYRSVNPTPYTPGTRYKFRMIIHVPQRRYTTYVQPQGQAERLLA